VALACFTEDGQLLVASACFTAASPVLWCHDDLVSAVVVVSLLEANLLVFLLLPNFLQFLLVYLGILQMDLHWVVHNYFILLALKYAVTIMYTLFSAYPFAVGLRHLHLLVQKAPHGCHLGQGIVCNRRLRPSVLPQD
jgi:hypothetical protein